MTIKEALLHDVFVLCLLCLSITGNSAGLALTKLQNDHGKNIHELVSRGWFMDYCLNVFSFL